MKFTYRQTFDRSELPCISTFLKTAILTLLVFWGFSGAILQISIQNPLPKVGPHTLKTPNNEFQIGQRVAAPLRCGLHNWQQCGGRNEDKEHLYYG
jgi:hypothetical protein